MKIEVFSDVICPWCYVGFARLQEALASRPEVAAEVRWLPFELNPATPEAGRDRREYLRERFGTENPFGDSQKQLTEMGRSLGLDFQFDRIERSPNTRRAHMLIALAGRHDAARQGAVKRALLQAYFEHGQDIGDVAVLAEIAASCGIEPAETHRALGDAALRAEVEQAEEMGRGWGISGVPTFIFERRYAFSGAQPLEAFQQVFDRVAADAAPAAQAGSPRQRD